MALTDLFTSIADAIRTKDGTTGTIVANTFAQRILDIPSGEEGLKTGVITVATDTHDSLIIEHNLGTVPRFVFVIAENGTKTNGSSYGCLMITYGDSVATYMFRYWDGILIGNQDGQVVRNITTTSLEYPVAYSTNYFRAGWNYRWVVF